MQTKKLGNPAQRDNLDEPCKDLPANSSLRPVTRMTSLALEAELNPGLTLAAVARLAAFPPARRPRARRSRR